MSKRLGPIFSNQLPWLQRLARRLARQFAEDLAQDTLTRALARRSSADAQHPRAFLATVARHLVVDAARRTQARGGAAVALDALPEALAPWALPDQETTLLLKQVVMALPPLYRDVFILNRFLGLTYPEIATRRGISVKTVEYRMSRALALCQEMLRDEA